MLPRPSATVRRVRPFHQLSIQEHCSPFLNFAEYVSGPKAHGIERAETDENSNPFFFGGRLNLTSNSIDTRSPTAIAFLANSALRKKTSLSRV